MNDETLPDMSAQVIVKAMAEYSRTLSNMAKIYAEVLDGVIDDFMELQNTLLEICQAVAKSPHFSRIKHLMTYGKTRTREKNRKRMIRIIDKCCYIALQKNKTDKERNDG